METTLLLTHSIKGRFWEGEASISLITDGWDRRFLLATTHPATTPFEISVNLDWTQEDINIWAEDYLSRYAAGCKDLAPVEL